MAKKALGFLFFVSIFIFFLHSFDGNGDFYHHIDTGRWILDNHQLPRVDSFTFTQNGQPWVAHSWASGILFYLLFKAFGPLGVSIFTSLIAVLTCAMLYQLLRLKGIKTEANLLTIGLVAAAVSTRFLERPEIIAYPLILLLFIIDEKRRGQPKLNLLLPVIVLSWASLYGSSVILGVLLVLFFGFKQLVRDKFRLKNDQRLLYVAIAASLVASYLNGYGFRTIFYIFIYIPGVKVYEGEWAGILEIIRSFPATLLLTYQFYLIIYAAFVGLLVTLCLVNWKILRKHLFEILPALAIFLPIEAFRQLPTAEILCAPLLASLLNSVKLKNISVAIFLILSAMIGLSIYANPPSLSTPNDQQLLGMTAFIKDHQIKGRAFNHTHFGGFITYNFYPDILTFIDTRDDLYKDSSVLQDLYQTSSSNADVLPLLQKYGADIVIADTQTDQLNYRSIFYSPAWKVVYLNDRYFLVVSKELAEADGLKAISTVDPFSATASKPGQEELANGYYQGLIDQGYDSYLNRFYLSETQISLDQTAAAVKNLSQISIQGNSPLAPLLKSEQDYLLAEGYLKEADCQMTVKFLNLAEQSSGRVLFVRASSEDSAEKEKVSALYDLSCLKDTAAAKSYLDSFMAEPGVSPLEKAKLLKEFSDVSMKP